MGSRDHSIECDVCGLGRGGMNDLRCDCDDPHARLLLDAMIMEAESMERLDALASNLAIAAALCRAYDGTHRNTRAWEHGDEVLWRPGCGTPAP